MTREHCGEEGCLDWHYAECRRVLLNWLVVGGTFAAMAIGIVVALSGCTRPLGVAYPTRPTLTAWQAAGFPLGKCADLELRLRLIYSYPQLRRECRRGNKVTWACSMVAGSGFAGSNVYWLMRVIANDPAHPVDKLIAHEFTHVAASCGFGVADRDHLNKRLWDHYDWVLKRAVPGFESRALEVQR